MKLVPYDAKEIIKGYKLCKNQRLIQEFLNSGLDCAKLEDFPQKDAKGCASSLSISLKRMGINNVKVCSRKGNVFLLKIDE